MAFYGTSNWKLVGNIKSTLTRTIEYLPPRKSLAVYEYNIEDLLQRKSIDGTFHTELLGFYHKFNLTLYNPTKEELDNIYGMMDYPTLPIFYPHTDVLGNYFSVNIVKCKPVYDKNQTSLIAILLVLETEEYKNLIDI